MARKGAVDAANDVDTSMWLSLAYSVGEGGRIEKDVRLKKDGGRASCTSTCVAPRWMTERYQSRSTPGHGISGSPALRLRLQLGIWTSKELHLQRSFMLNTI